jgi:hypothetical protein
MGRRDRQRGARDPSSSESCSAERWPEFLSGMNLSPRLDQLANQSAFKAPRDSALSKVPSGRFRYSAVRIEDVLYGRALIEIRIAFRRFFDRLRIHDVRNGDAIVQDRLHELAIIGRTGVWPCGA